MVEGIAALKRCIARFGRIPRPEVACALYGSRRFRNGQISVISHRRIHAYRLQMQPCDLEAERLSSGVLRQQYQRGVFDLDILNDHVGIGAFAAAEVMPLAFGRNVDFHALQRNELNRLLGLEQHSEVDGEEYFLDTE